jgi:prepilin-type processing-associated H-X9-DG protein
LANIPYILGVDLVPLAPAPRDAGLSAVIRQGPVGGAPGGFNSLITPSSNHPGGLNVTFCDGSVRFLKDTINPQTWWAIGSRNLGEVVSADAY